MCFYPHLLVCLSVSHITGKRVIGFHESYRIGQTWYKEQSGTFWGCSVKPLAYMISFSIFSGESVSVSNITEKQVNGFSLSFQDRSNMRQVTILIFIFSVSILTKNSTEKLVNGFQCHFHDMLDTEQQNNWLDCHVQINWFLVCE